MNNPITEARLFNPASHPRLTYSVNMYHQMPGEDAKQFQFNGDTILDEEETPYDRPVAIGPIWTRLDWHWLTPDKIKTIVLFNGTGAGRQVKPTDEEIAADAAAIIVVKQYPGLIVQPKSMPTVIHVDESFAGIDVRSLEGVAKLRYIGIPR